MVSTAPAMSIGILVSPVFAHAETGATAPAGGADGIWTAGARGATVGRSTGTAGGGATVGRSAGAAGGGATVVGKVAGAGAGLADDVAAGVDVTTGAATGAVVAGAAVVFAAVVDSAVDVVAACVDELGADVLLTAAVLLAVTAIATCASCLQKAFFSATHSSVLAKLRPAEHGSSQPAVS
mmetsp:Transcript_124619/g.360487  ORF Transcript_124619/g.360487 Transcript_124619/m.360487 type:complete len:181 (-) Transcript_124619:486-1028(-)